MHATFPVVPTEFFIAFLLFSNYRPHWFHFECIFAAGHAHAKLRKNHFRSFIFMFYSLDFISLHFNSRNEVCLLSISIFLSRSAWDYWAPWFPRISAINSKFQCIAFVQWHSRFYCIDIVSWNCAGGCLSPLRANLLSQ